MKRFTIATCFCWLGLTGIALAQPLAGTTGSVTSPVKSVAAPAWGNVEPLAPQTAPAPSSPGEAEASREVRAHELHLMQAQAQEESIHRAAVARAEQRTRRLESQRWFGISNTRPSASIDPFDGDYSPFWASNYPFYPMRWVGGSEPWGFVEGQ